MEKALRRLVASKEYVCIHLDPADEKFTFGKIIGNDEKRFVALIVTPDGSDDGILVAKIQEIQFIERDGQYQKKMERLMNICGYKERKPEITGELLQWGLSYAIENRFVVAMEIADSKRYDITGIIESVDDGICRVRQIDSYGESDGEALARVDDISQLCIDSEDERIRMSLFESEKV